MTHPQTPLKFLFHVVFSDNTEFSQTQEDVDSQDPKRSAFTEYLRLCTTKTPARFSLKSETDVFSVSLYSGKIWHNDELIYTPEVELSTENNVRVIYSRDVTQHKTVPATFYNPKGYRELSTGHLMVRDSLGHDHIFPEDSRMQYERKDKDLIYYVYPRGDSTEVVFKLGWQATVNGENIRKVIEIS